jgi:hypothetical protein
VSEFQWVALIPLVGFLILNLSWFRNRNVGWRRTLYIAGAWAGIFAIVILFISIVR